MLCFWFHSDSETDINEYLQRWGLNHCAFHTLKITSFENGKATAKPYTPPPPMWLVHFKFYYKVLHHIWTHTDTRCWFLTAWPGFPVLFISALRAWRRLDGAHQLIRKEILLQLQDGGVPVGEAQRMAGEVGRPDVQSFKGLVRSCFHCVSFDSQRTETERGNKDRGCQQFPQRPGLQEGGHASIGSPRFHRC